MWRAKQLIFIGVAFASCGPSDPPQLTQAEMMDPQACAQCHQQHVTEWSGSMHAYAADDPVFVAMNARFQREAAASGSDPSLCVKCHAPLALSTGATTDGTNLASVDSKLHGVTCFFCHEVSAVAGPNNAQLMLANDGVMRGPIMDPAHGAPHGSVYSALHDSADLSSSSMCGSCHDLQNGHGVSVETTFSEWQASVYASDSASVGQTCTRCHMYKTIGPASTSSGAPQNRAVHDHSLAAFDVALTTFPQTDAQRTLVQQTLDASITAKLCVMQPTGGPNVTLTLDNAFVGHAFPSGAAHDRRVWVELIAYAAGVTVFSTGVVANGQSVTDLNDPSLWLLRDQLTDGASQPVTFLWEAFATNVTNLPPGKDVTTPHSVTRTFTVPPATDRVTVRVLAVPIGLDVLADLADGGDLSPSFASSMPTFVLEGTQHEWTTAVGYATCVGP